MRMTSEHKRTGRFAPEILHKYFLCHEKYLKYQEKFIRKENVISKIIKKQADDLFKIAVALHAGAWIEMQFIHGILVRMTSRTPCECVD